jgi:nicotinate-nucleotide adenylyltransferase
VLADEAASQLGLDAVLLVPTGIAPHKEIEDDPGAEVRAEMARLAAGAGEGAAARLEVCELELRRTGPSYAYETLEALREERPHAELVWLMGADAALGLGSWKRPERIVELARLGIVAREGVMRSDLDEVLGRLGIDGERPGPPGAVAVEMPTIGISSSAVRTRVREGRPIRHLVPEPVAGLIAERGLYGG